MVNADGFAKHFETYRRSRVAFNGSAGGRVILVTGHAGDAVVENNHGRVTLVISNINKAGYAGMHKGRVTDNRNGLFRVFGVCLVAAVQSRNRSTHTDAGIHHTDWRKRAQCIAADVAADHDVQLFQCIVKTAVRTTGAKHRRTARNFYIRGKALVFFAENHAGN